MYAPARPAEGTGGVARLYQLVLAAEARLRLAEQETPPSQTSPSEFAKQQEAPETAKQQAASASREEEALPTPEATEADERQAQLRALASDLLYWKGGLKVLRMAQLPKWRGCFKWQIEAKIVALQEELARLRTDAAEPDG